MFHVCWCRHSVTVWVSMSGVDIFCASMGLGRQMVEGIGPETGTHWEAIYWVSTWWGIVERGSAVQFWVRPKVNLSWVWLFLVKLVTADQKTLYCFLSFTWKIAFFGLCLISELCLTSIVTDWTRNSQTQREGDFGSDLRFKLLTPLPMISHHVETQFKIAGL